MEDAEIRDAMVNAGLNPDSDDAQGRIWIQYAKRGQPRKDWYLTTFNVVLLRFANQLTVQGTAGGTTSTPFDLAIDLSANALVLKVSVDGRNHVWNIDTTHSGVKLLVASNPEQMLLQINADFTFYGHYNLMHGSQLVVRARVV